MQSARALTVVLISMASLVILSTRLESSAAAPSQDALHEVLPGDDLRLIAGYYYGDSRQWQRIWNANRDQIRKPNRIEQGIYLRIPDATVPTESYADFVARARRALPAQAGLTIPAVPPIPPDNARIPDGLSASPEPPAKLSPDRVALPAPTKAPPATAPPAPPQKAAAPVAPPAPQSTKPPAVAVTPAGAQAPPPAPSKQATTPPAPPATKAPGPPARPAPPPPRTWYEEWGLDELVASPLFLGGIGVVILGLAAILLIRRRRSAASTVAEIPE